MRETTAQIPYNPVGVGVEYPFSADKIVCRPGEVTFRGKVHKMAAKSVVPVLYSTKLGETGIYLVFDGSKVVYHTQKSSSGSPAKTLEEQGLTPLVRLALVQIAAGKGLADAGGQIVTVEPMIETVYKKQIGEDGKPITKHVTEKFPDGSVTERDVPLMEQTERIVTV